jgi:hypothetical protein
MSARVRTFRRGRRGRFDASARASAGGTTLSSGGSDVGFLRARLGLADGPDSGRSSMPAMIPSATGNSTDVRWVALVVAGSGIEIEQSELTSRPSRPADKLAA